MARSLDASAFGRRSCRGGGQDTCLYRHGVPVCPPFPRHGDGGRRGTMSPDVPMSPSSLVRSDMLQTTGRLGRITDGAEDE